MSWPLNTEIFRERMGEALPLIQGARRILVTAPRGSRGDALATVLALAQGLKTETTNVLAVVPNTIAEKWRFLPAVATICQSLAATRPLEINVNTNGLPISEVRYEQTESGLRFVITPGAQALEASAVSAAVANETFDLIVAVGALGLEQFEELMTEDARLFYDTPVIAIDNRVEHSGFGELNLVRLTASSLAEIAYDLIEATSPGRVANQPDLATLLLAGIIAATTNFQDVHTTPDCLQLAAELIRQGADQQLIIKQLFRTKPLAALKLWGLAMVGLTFDELSGAVATQLAPEHFGRTQTSAKEVGFVIDELRANFSRANVLGLVWQTSAEAPVNGYVESRHQDLLSGVEQIFGGARKNQHLIFQSSDEILSVTEKLTALLADSGRNSKLPGA